MVNINSSLSGFSFTLPKLFLRFLEKSGGGYKKLFFSYYDVGLERELTEGIGSVYTVLDNDPEMYNIVKEHNCKPEFFPENLVAFTEMGNGDHLCFDYSSDKNRPQIVYWCHDAPTNKSISFVAKDFEEFMSMLKEPENAGD